MRLFLLLLALSLLCLASARTVSEYRALLSLRQAITDDPQSSLSSWKESTSYCSWPGVTCDARRHVIALDLSSLDLSGTLSSEIQHLLFLQNLTLAVNQFSGSIPPEISAIGGIRFLNLSNNGFNGTFPPQLTRLKSLQVLDLYNNNMTGDLPIAVTEMTSLRHLHLGGNYFAGKIPPEYGRWEFLEYLAVSSNRGGGNRGRR